MGQALCHAVLCAYMYMCVYIRVHMYVCACECVWSQSITNTFWFLHLEPMVV